MHHRPFPFCELTCRPPDRHFPKRRTSHLQIPNTTTYVHQPPIIIRQTNKHIKHQSPLPRRRTSCSAWCYRPEVATTLEQPVYQHPSPPCSSRPTLLQSLVAQNSPSLPETRPSLEASLARSPHPLRPFSLCDSVSCPDAVISECLRKVSPQSCFGDSAVDGDWRLLRRALGSHSTT